MRNEASAPTFEPGAEADFLVHDGGVAVIGGAAEGNEVRLQLSGDGSAATGLTYFGRKGPGQWIVNENGIGMLTFRALPIDPE